MQRGERERATERQGDQIVYEDFLHILTTSPEVAQSYETLLSSLHLLNSTRPLRTLLVTSTQPEEGKTTVTINLALTMVLAGKSVLLLDTDWRKPRLHQFLKLENTHGFADILSGRVAVQDVIQVVKIGHRGPDDRQTLSVITSGRPVSGFHHAAGSPHLKQALAHCATLYDVVLLDSPPTLSVSDPLLVAPMVDGVILVLNPGVVTQQEAKRAKKLLADAGAHILGVVMNRFDQRLHGPGFHPYHGYYDGARPRG
jgi:capsular exopolysaccharide synthesis family protein